MKPALINMDYIILSHLSLCNTHSLNKHMKIESKQNSTITLYNSGISEFSFWRLLIVGGTIW